MPVPCSCCSGKAVLKKPKTAEAMCKECFFTTFENEVHRTIVDAQLFTAGDRVAIGASGGKDSTVLAYIMNLLNERHQYGVHLELLSIDEGITGYRDDSLETVKRNQQQYGLPLRIISYEELYGWTMDAIVKEIGLKNNCTFCGVFRRQALDRGAMLLNCNKIVTGHNADDIAETVVMNVLRGDIARLQRCTAITTGLEGTLPRCKPFKYIYEKEIVMYAYFKKLDYFSTECIYSPNAYRGHARAFIKDLERIRPLAILDIIHSGERLMVKKDVKLPVQGVCNRCNYVSSQPLCKACLLLEGLNRGLPKKKMVWNSVRRFLCNPQFARSPNDQIAFCAFLFGAHLSLWYEVCHVLPYYYSTQMSPVALLHTTIAVGLYLNTLVNVYAMVRTRTACNLTVIGVGDENTAWPFCERCVGRQPPRSHHCPICDVCVLRRDHHCWFAGCCVGHANQRYYICAIMSMAVAAIYANVFHWQFVLDQLGRLGAFGMPACILVPHACALFGFVSLYEFLVTSLTFLALFVAVMLTWLTVLQLIQIRHGQTQYERKNGVKRYDNGLLCNIRTVFGDRWYVAWISPWIRSSLPENGAVFKVSGVKDK